MADGSFSDLPADLHNSLRSAWTDETRPASALLGLVGQQAEPTPDLHLADLPDSVYSASTSELRGFVEEHEKAIDDFINGLDTVRKSAQNDTSIERAIDGLLTENFDDKFLTLTPQVLQAVVTRIVTENQARYYSRRAYTHRSVELSPLFSVWSERLRQQGVKQPKINVEWPTEAEQTDIDFGDSMHDVDLTITGRAKGTLGTKAKNCRIKITHFTGSVLRNAEDSSVTAQTVDGPVLNSAKGSALECKELDSGHITLGKSCKIKAKTVRCTTISAERIAKSNDTEPPCEVNVGHIFGTFRPGDDWKVEVGEVTEPPRPVTTGMFPSSYYGNEIEMQNIKPRHGLLLSNEETYQQQIPTEITSEDLIFSSMKRIIENKKQNLYEEIQDKKQSPQQDEILYNQNLQDKRYNKIGETSLGHLIYRDKREKY